MFLNLNESLNKIEENKKCLDSEEYQKEYNNYNFSSTNHEMYLQEGEKLTLSIFDDKRNSLNTKESLAWNWCFCNHPYQNSRFFFIHYSLCRYLQPMKFLYYRFKETNILLIIF